MQHRDTLSHILMGVVVVVLLVLMLGVVSLFFPQLFPIPMAAAATATPTATPTATATATPTATPTATATATASPTPTSTPKTTTTTASPTASPVATSTTTPTTLPDAQLVLSTNAVTSVNGVEQVVLVETAENATVNVTSTSGITTWYESGFLYIYPGSDGTVTVQAKEPEANTVSQEVAVTMSWVQETTTAPVVDSGSTGMIAPTLTQNDDLSFYFRPGTGMEGTKDLFFQYAAEQGCDPWLAIAIACHETGYGTSSYCKDLFNFGGNMDSSGNIKTFIAPWDGIEYLCSILGIYKNRYGLTTIEQIGDRYCPGEPLWVTRVTTIYNSFQK